jgi:hypothetical protein
MLLPRDFDEPASYGRLLISCYSASFQSCRNCPRVWWSARFSRLGCSFPCFTISIVCPASIPSIENAPGYTTWIRAWVSSYLAPSRPPNTVNDFRWSTHPTRAPCNFSRATTSTSCPSFVFLGNNLRTPYCENGCVSGVWGLSGHPLRIMDALFDSYWV